MKLLEQLQVVARRRGLARNTIDAYSLWVKHFLTFSARRNAAWKHPIELGTTDVEHFLNDLVMGRRLSGSSQNQALNALVFLYSHVLDTIPQNHLGKFLLERSRRSKRIPTVLSADEVRRVIEAIPPDRISRLMVELMYGTGMRVSEVCTLRVRDIDLGRAQIIVRAAKGDKDRVVMLPESLGERVSAQAQTGGRSPFRHLTAFRDGPGGTCHRDAAKYLKPSSSGCLASNLGLFTFRLPIIRERY